MANNVNTLVYFQEISEEGKSRLAELCSRIRKEDGYREWFADMFVDGQEGSPIYEQTETYDWMVENVGSKWAYVEDYEEEMLRVISAWSAPLNGIEWLSREIGKVDPNVIIHVQYEDEMPNFIGCAVYDRDGQYEMWEWEWEEIREIMHSEIPELLEHWDAEEEEGDEEYNDMLFDNIWEMVETLQSAKLDELQLEHVEYVKERDEDVL
jgi:PAS domain-containing protein